MPLYRERHIGRVLNSQMKIATGIEPVELTDGLKDFFDCGLHGIAFLHGYFETSAHQSGLTPTSPVRPGMPGAAWRDGRPNSECKYAPPQIWIAFLTARCGLHAEDHPNFIWRVNRYWIE
ncbi:MAG: hypothetical protein A2428_08745 [Bdellovibrionales bacterium RIFOXYC1_FULL_54_43]|nr:MAG: hypothetical protein A2428_08745 [Bdellovibrionales bacterium RIFOXYC1_FULL_54_43]